MIRNFAVTFACLFMLIAVQNSTEAQTPASGRCAPAGSTIALFTRQAFDEGREAIGRQYAKLVGELASIAGENLSERAAVEQSIDAVRNFSATMNSQGHDVTVEDIIIHREGEMVSLLRIVDQPITKARYALQLAIIREMKRSVCER